MLCAAAVVRCAASDAAADRRVDGAAADDVDSRRVVQLVFPISELEDPQLTSEQDAQFPVFDVLEEVITRVNPDGWTELGDRVEEGFLEAAETTVPAVLPKDEVTESACVTLVLECGVMEVKDVSEPGKTSTTPVLPSAGARVEKMAPVPVLEATEIPEDTA